jgi:hypothetical protein
MPGVRGRKASGTGLTSAQQQAKAIFKPVKAALTGDQLEKQAFDQNRERRKALRLARDSIEGYL